MKMNKPAIEVINFEVSDIVTASGDMYNPEYFVFDGEKLYYYNSEGTAEDYYRGGRPDAATVLSFQAAYQRGEFENTGLAFYIREGDSWTNIGRSKPY